ncbi:hypothetical protein J2Z69_002685 [Paenibacillus shirakamiensis]|uniref:Uncharacterized protein n=1 Tax=Paenibacillus shirakamiensis TaxID=1265935 RepID=A0ABS4JKP1_9BACL|nr:hypothetical protein [Paenibacillus shirakamiensis]MBP2001640.1 hypothetical protein [Paenibacillus shirakamiensis]
MECIVHFNVVHPDKVKELRGLILLEAGTKPTEADFLSMFSDMGFQLIVKDREKLIFAPTDPGADYKEIRIRELDTGEDKYVEDKDLKSVITNLLPPTQRPI